jgi:FkbM family methyltransferase
MTDRSFSLTRFSENRFTRPIKRGIVRSFASKAGPRKILNRYYDLLSDEEKARFHERYSKLYRENGNRLATGEWHVRFLDKRIQLPLRSSWSWLDWDSALSIIGHDNEVKQTYAALIASDERPGIFLDVGANYGTHSVLFLAAGIPVIAFEPNLSCYPHFKTICELNGLSGWWEQVAIGDKVGQIELAYPEKDTWLGSVHLDRARLQNSGKVVTQQVSLRTLDYYLHDIPQDKILIKIDVEGYEREVIRGASRLFKDRKPKLIFENYNTSTRTDLFELLQESGHHIHELPYRPDEPSPSLRINEFLASKMTNFIAVVPRIHGS